MTTETTMKYRKKPVVIEAFQLRNQRFLTMPDWILERYDIRYIVDSITEHTKEYVIGMTIPTLEGTMRADEGDWIIKGVQGALASLYSCWRTEKMGLFWGLPIKTLEK